MRMLSGLVCAGLSIATLSATKAPVPPTNNQSQPAAAEVRDGSVTFNVETNVFAVSVHGESKDLDAKVRVHESAEGMRLEQIEAVVPVKSLSTGMKLRDDHMRKYIFQTPDGQVPDVRFTAERAECSGAGANGAAKCVASGQLAIRGTARPFVMELAVTRENDLFRVQGDGTVKLSAYGIERPSQFGVKTADDVKLHLELSARSAAPSATLSAGKKQ
jgi:polyisoprenoid-binding protein YceI